MVQLDPAQKQAPAAIEAFDRRQIIIQAKRDVTLLLEKSKSVINSEKGKLENLQIISSFTVLAKPGHAADTYEIYRIEVNKVNEQLIRDKANFNIQLEETSPGKLFIVCGRYEEREPKVAEEAKEEVRQTVYRMEKLPPWRLSEQDNADITVTKEKLATMDPLELTDKQWEVFRGRIYRTARMVKHKDFGKLTNEEKLDVVRCAISPHEKAAKKIGFKYPEPGDPKMDDIQKAAETLSTRKGDCDDLSLLYIACLKRLADNNEIDLKGASLVIAGYLDPDGSTVKAHANTLQVLLKGGNRNVYLADLTFNTSVKDMGTEPEKGIAGGSDFKNKFAEHMNESRDDGLKLSPSLMELQVYSGYSSVEVYYYEKKGEYLLKNSKDSDAADELSEGINRAEKNGVSCANAYFLRAEAYLRLGKPWIDEGSTHSSKGEMKEAAQCQKMGDEFYQCVTEDREKGVAAPVQSNYSLYRGGEFLFNRGERARGEQSVYDAAVLAPFRTEDYKTLFEMYSKEGKYEEAIAKFSELRLNLDKTAPGSDGMTVTVRQEIDNCIKKAEKALEK